MKSKKYILKRKVVFEKSSEELWGAYPWLPLISKQEGDEYINSELDLYIKTDIDTNSKTKDIPIKDIKNLITEAEKAGANYIQIDWNCDHQEYDIYGSKVTVPSSEELKNILKKERISRNMAISGRIRKLQKEIENLEYEKKK